jgi:hypothetical protein
MWIEDGLLSLHSSELSPALPDRPLGSNPLSAGVSVARGLWSFEKGRSFSSSCPNDDTLGTEVNGLKFQTVPLPNQRFD